MTFSSAYLFAKQITAGNPSLPSNVIFDNGQFNSQRMKDGFDIANNVSFIQDLYPGMNYGSGATAIERGAMASVIQADESTTLASHGADNTTIYVENNYLTHVGSNIIGDDSSAGYYMPVNMQSVLTEGYSKMCVKLGYSTPFAVGGNLTIYLYGMASNYSFTYIGGDLHSMPATSEETEVTVYSIFDGATSAIPRYLGLGMSNGTYHIKKIWFE